MQPDFDVMARVLMDIQRQRPKFIALIEWRLVEVREHPELFPASTVAYYYDYVLSRFDKTLPGLYRCK